MRLYLHNFEFKVVLNVIHNIGGNVVLNVVHNIIQNQDTRLYSMSHTKFHIHNIVHKAPYKI